MLEGEGEEGRRALVMLNGGTAPFRLKLACGREHLGKRLCRECERNEKLEDYNHWMLRCPSAN